MIDTIEAPRVTVEQFTRIRSLLSLFNVPTVDALRRAQRISGRQVESIMELSPKEAARLIQELEPNRGRRG
jgi:hypothetical protein